MKAEIVKLYRPKKDFSVENIKFTKVVFENKEYEIYITRVQEDVVTFLHEVSFKPNPGDFFYIGEKGDKDVKLKVLK